jgi:hypothetical protein
MTLDVNMNGASVSLSKEEIDKLPELATGFLSGCPSWCTDHDYTADPQSESHAATLEIGDELFVSICQHVRNPEPLPELYVDIQADGTGVNLRHLATALLDTADRYDAVIREDLGTRV